MNMDEMADAIRHRRVLKAYYDGGERIFEPHSCGYGSSRQGLVRCYQVSGFSQSGKSSGWKLWLLEKISSCSATGSTFENPRDGYNSLGDRHIPTIVEKV